MLLAEILAIVISAIWPIVQGIGAGVCLAIGFWIAKMITGRIDEWRICSNQAYMSEVAAAI